MRYFLGIDENGLGPIMGPLVVTGVFAQGRKKFFNWFPGVEDSKTFFRSRDFRSFKKMEEMVIAAFFAVYNYLPAGPMELIEKISGFPSCPFVIPVEHVPADCKQGAGIHCGYEGSICYKNVPDSFLWAEISKAEEQGRELKKWMAIEKCILKQIICKVVCPHSFNAFLEKGNSKLFLDFVKFVEIIKDTGKDNIEIFAGKIGGLKDYLPYLRYSFQGWEITKIEEKKELSFYHIIKNQITRFKIGFYLNVEKTSFLAALSSIIGKYVREIFMYGINVSLGNVENRVSGYRDKRTAAFISKNRSLFKSLNIPKKCLFRCK